jgi:hypothetical protein
MTTKNLAYDHATYITRVSAPLGQIAAGAAGVSQKFIAFAQLQVLSVTATLFTAGTATVTAWNGTATTTSAAGDSFSLIHISNSAAIGATPVLTTNTHGPYALGLFNGTATAVQTAVSGAFVSVALGTNTGIGSPVPATGGFNANQGDQMYVVRGADATAVSAYALEYNVLPLSNVTA